MSFFNYRSRFLIKNIIKGLAALALLVIIYILLQIYTPFEEFLAYIGRWPLLVYMIFIFSEVCFGLIPPEFFMMWSIKDGLFENYAFNVALLAAISYLAGVLGYWIGAKSKHIAVFKKFLYRPINRYKNTLNRYGSLLIVVGAVTPVPFSAICMLIGATNYNFYRFLMIASTRLLRFTLYSIVIYQANI